MNEKKALESDVLIQQLQDSVSKANLQNDLKLTCLALEKLGQAYLDKREAPGALTQFEEALKIANKIGNKELQAQLFGYKGLALKMLGNYVMALQAFRRSNSIASNLGHNLLLCDSYLQIGILKSEMGDQEKALADLIQALEIATEEQDSVRMMRTAGSLANNLYAINTFDKAREYYSFACEQARSLGNPIQQSVPFLPIWAMSFFRKETGRMPLNNMSARLA